MSLRLNVRTLTGGEMFEIPLCESFGQFKDRVAAHFGFPENQVRIIVEGNTLHAPDTATMDSLNAVYKFTSLNCVHAVGPVPVPVPVPAPARARARARATDPVNPAVPINTTDSLASEVPSVASAAAPPAPPPAPPATKVVFVPVPVPVSGHGHCPRVLFPDEEGQFITPSYAAGMAGYIVECATLACETPANPVMAGACAIMGYKGSSIKAQFAIKTMVPDLIEKIEANYEDFNSVLRNAPVGLDECVTRWFSADFIVERLRAVYNVYTIDVDSIENCNEIAVRMLERLAKMIVKSILTADHLRIFRASYKANAADTSGASDASGALGGGGDADSAAGL